MSGAISPSDRTFLRYFSMLIGGLALLLLILLVFAWFVHASGPHHEDPQRAVATTARLQPVGAVYAGDTGRAAMAAAKAAAAKAAAGKVAYGGTTDGEAIFNHLCTTCHTAGVAGAPKLGDTAEWAPRIAEGIDTLIKHAINGYTGPDGNHMPAKGGNLALTDKQVANTVKWMVAQSR